MSVRVGTAIAQSSNGTPFVPVPNAGGARAVALQGAIVIGGTFGVGATVALQYEVGGAWFDHPTIAAIAAADEFLLELGADEGGAFVVPAIPADRYRIAVTGGDGTTAIDVDYAGTQDIGT